MDAHLFRRVCMQLMPLLRTSRIDGIAALAPNIVQCKLYAATGKYTLIIKISRDKPCLMLVPQALSPQAFGYAIPPAFIMRLRKYALRRRIVDVRCSWLTRCLHLHIGGESPCILTIDSGHGVYIQHEPTENIKLPSEPLGETLSEPLGEFSFESPTALPNTSLAEAFDEFSPLSESEHIENSEKYETYGIDDIVWPPPEALQALTTNTGNNEALWRAYPVLTPALRRTLVHLEPMEQQALLMDLQEGGGDVFALYDVRNGNQDDARNGNQNDARNGNQDDERNGNQNDEQGICALHAWPLPEALCKGRTQKAFEDVFEAIAAYGKRTVLDVLASNLHREERKKVHTDKLRLQRLLEHLDRDYARLTAMQGQQEEALRLQTWLHSLPAHSKLPSLILPSCDGVEPELSISLNPALTVRENMQAMFHTALRGKRGFAHVARRRQEVLMTLEALELGKNIAESGQGGLLAKRPIQQGNAEKSKGAKGSTKTGSKPVAKNKLFPKNIQVSISEDGFTLWRGRDAKGNLAVLRHAASHDLWLHVESGHGAHVVIRRDHTEHTIPERTLHEAARLCGSKSWCSDVQGQSEITIMTAFVRHVRPRKGAALGMVDIQLLQDTIRLAL